MVSKRSLPESADAHGRALLGTERRRLESTPRFSEHEELEAAVDRIDRDFFVKCVDFFLQNMNVRRPVAAAMKAFNQQKNTALFQAASLRQLFIDGYQEIDNLLDHEDEIEKIVSLQYNIYNNWETYRLISIAHIEEKPSIERVLRLSSHERAAEVEKFAMQTNGVGVADFLKRMFPEIFAVGAGHPARDGSASAKNGAKDGFALPIEAPELYQGLRGSESPPEFVKRVYGPWLGHGLTRAYVNKLDPGLYRAIDNWSRKPGNQWPADVDLPTLKEQNTRWVERVEREGMAAVISDGPADTVLREARRLAGIKHRRTKDKREI